MSILQIDVDWMPKGFEAIRIGKPEYGEFFIFNGNIYQYSELPFKDLLTGEILDKFPDDMPVYCAQESILGDADHSRVIYAPLVICDGDLISDHDGKLYIGDLFDRS